MWDQSGRAQEENEGAQLFPQDALEKPGARSRSANSPGWARPHRAPGSRPSHGAASLIYNPAPRLCASGSSLLGEPGHQKWVPMEAVVGEAEGPALGALGGLGLAWDW